jgi:dipeptidyl aminopeptidase/acylaminoacyl peptidase
MTFRPSPVVDLRLRRRRRWTRIGLVGVVAVVAALAATTALLVRGFDHPGAAVRSPRRASRSVSPQGRAVIPSPGTASAGSPTLVGVTTGGVLQVLDLTNGAPLRTLAMGASGDQVSLSPDGARVYFESATGCFHQIDEVPVGGGTPTVIADGSVPAVSPDGAQLAYVRQPFPDEPACAGQDFTPGSYVLVVRTLATGAETTYPLAPTLSAGGLPFPIDHLSWSGDGQELAVSIAAAQDNGGWAVALVRPATDTFYYSGASVPIASGTPAGSYYREGVFLPDGNLFVNLVCCEGVPVREVSTLLVEVSASTGTVVRHVAVGFTTRDHSGLAVDRSGEWLAYLSGDELYVSYGGQRPVPVASGFVAAGW